MSKSTLKNLIPLNFDSYFRFVDQDEWDAYWKVQYAKERSPRGKLCLVITPLGDFIEVFNGSANHHVCDAHISEVEKLQLATEFLRVEYYLKHDDSASLIREFEISDSAIHQMMTRRPQSERFISQEVFAKARGLARVVANRKAALAALKSLEIP